MGFSELFSLISNIAGPLVKRVLSVLGVGTVSLSGINLLFQSAESYIKAQFGGVMPEVAAILGLAKVDVALNIVLAAIVTRAVIAGMSKAGSLLKFGLMD